MEITVNRKIRITEEDVDYILTTAIEGGIGYWCASVRPTEGKWLDPGEDGMGIRYNVMSEGRELAFTITEPMDDSGRTVYVMDRQAMLDGIAKYVNGDYTYSSSIIDDTEALDWSVLDAEVADCMVQLALFGELVFG